MLKMKSCPRCERTYSDLSLSYCLNDGSLLSAPFNSDKFQTDVLEKTVAFTDETKTVVSRSESMCEPTLDVSLENNRIAFGENFSVTFQRTLRIPDDGKNYPLPPGLGVFPLCRISDYEDRVPKSWIDHGGVFIPMYQREALWLDFRATYRRPNVVKVAAGKINAVTGKTWDQSLSSSHQDYMVCPPQKWIDGFKTGAGVVRQFVAMPLGRGYTVEEQLSGNDEFGGIQIIVFDPKPSMFQEVEDDENRPLFSKAKQNDTEMGLAAGGKIRQKIYPDTHGVATWDENKYGRVFVHIVNSSMFKEITGVAAPSTPISADTYAEYGLPWFELYDEHLRDVPVGEELYTVKPVGLVDKIKGILSRNEQLSFDISKKQIKKIKIKNDQIEDGDW